MSRSRSQAEETISTTPAHVNAVRLVGRLAVAMSCREMPSGDTIGTFRLIVDRNPARRRPHGPTVDTIDCVVRTAGTQRTVGRWRPGDVIEVEGALRRRFWRTAANTPTSRYEVEVAAARRLVCAKP